MNNIKIKIKDREPSDDSILARKNFLTVINEYKTIKSSYAKVASFWGATIGMTVFLAFAASETLETKPNQRSRPNKKLVESIPLLDIESHKITTSSSNENMEVQETEIISSPFRVDSKQTVNKVAAEEGHSVINIEEKEIIVDESKKINVQYIPD
jgi:hypothetical protein